jgi:hypothetical protein
MSTQIRAFVRPSERRMDFRCDGEALLDCQPFREGRDRTPDWFCTVAHLSQATRELELSLKTLREESPAIAHTLKALDDKLNLVTALTLAQLPHGEHCARSINLSAGGMAFYASKPYAAGDLVEVRLLLLPDCSAVEAQGRVVRCERDPNAARDHPWRIALHFENLADSERDRVIRHLLALQQASARRSR